MSKITLGNVREAINNKQPFRGSNMWAEIMDSQYVVYSYGRHFPMYVFDFVSNSWFGNKDKFSRSTTRQQSATYPSADDIIWCDTKRMIRLAEYGYVNTFAHRLAA